MKDLFNCLLDSHAVCKINPVLGWKLAEPVLVNERRCYTESLRSSP